MQAGTVECPPHNTLPTFSATLRGTHLDVRKSECRKPSLQLVLSKHILSIIFNKLANIQHKIYLQKILQIFQYQ